MTRKMVRILFLSHVFYCVFVDYTIYKTEGTTNFLLLKKRKFNLLIFFRKMASALIQ